MDEQPSQVKIATIPSEQWEEWVKLVSKLKGKAEAAEEKAITALEQNARLEVEFQKQQLTDREQSNLLAQLTQAVEERHAAIAKAEEERYLRRWFGLAGVTAFMLAINLFATCNLVSITPLKIAIKEEQPDPRWSLVYNLAAGAFAYAVIFGKDHLIDNAIVKFTNQGAKSE